MTLLTAPARRRVLADLLPGAALRDAALIVGAAALTGLAAQISIPLPFTPVPITLQTFTVLLAGAALGPVRGSASMLLYLLVGVAGLGWFAEGRSGMAFASFGYIVGFVVAAGIVGVLARRGADRTVPGTIGLMVAGNLVIYAIGLPWLMAALGVDLSKGLEYGVTPFLVGDALKIGLAAGLLPATWWLIGSSRRG
ncbi:MAG TPA: biotin transporter BioY [Candidatus Limnocylindria bacterium]|jgi:biotin transport system substrate-specific component